MLKKSFLTIIFLLFLTLCLSQNEAWEPDEVIPFIEKVCEKKITHTTNNIISLFLINWYQKQNSKVTISKCPFHISCSNFAEKSIQKYGFYIGLCHFFDRFFFRENVSMYKNYPFIENEFKILKFNDDFYINKELRY